MTSVPMTPEQETAIAAAKRSVRQEWRQLAETLGLAEIEKRLAADEEAFAGPGYIGDDQCMRDSRYLLAELRKAWDSGFTACAQEHMRQNQDPTHPITRTNPYDVQP